MCIPLGVGRVLGELFAAPLVGEANRGSLTART